jgi:hypothetical protein
MARSLFGSFAFERQGASRPEGIGAATYPALVHSARERIDGVRSRAFIH